jgi:CsoR family transcriptional regulator, copper-sensing transcriptional repressor
MKIRNGAPCVPHTPCGHREAAGQGGAPEPRKGGCPNGKHVPTAQEEAYMVKQVKDQEALKKDVLARMKRIEGQVRGIQRMIDEGKECEDILVQVRAVRSALRSATGQIMRRYLMRCQEQSVATGDPVAQYEKLVKLITDFIDG